MSLGGGGCSQVMERRGGVRAQEGRRRWCAPRATAARGRVEYPAAYPGAVAVARGGPGRARARRTPRGARSWTSPAPGGEQDARATQDGILQNTIDRSDSATLGLRLVPGHQHGHPARRRRGGAALRRRRHGRRTRWRRRCSRAPGRRAPGHLARGTAGWTRWARWRRWGPAARRWTGRRSCGARRSWCSCSSRSRRRPGRAT